jgi:hypothetical protein
VQGDAGGDLCDFQTLVIDKSYLPIDEFVAIYAVNKPQLATHAGRRFLALILK